MLLISVEIMMKEKCKKQQQKNKRRQRGARGAEAIVKGWELNNFVVHLTSPANM